MLISLGTTLDWLTTIFRVPLIGPLIVFTLRSAARALVLAVCEEVAEGVVEL